jgi:hypothetical protein
MFHQDGHPDIKLSDWTAFRREFSRHLIEEVIDRSEIKLPDRFLQLARGVAIPSSYLLGRAGYRPGSRRPPGWYKPHCDVLWKDIGPDSLIVRGYCNQPLWAIERNGSPGRPHGHPNMALVHKFGSTPILARTYQAATYLAEFCYGNDPPAGLRWVDECPDDMSGAVEFYRIRRIIEAVIPSTRLSRLEAARGKGKTLSSPDTWIVALGSRLVPFIPQQRTSGDCIGMSVSCQKATCAAPHAATSR